MLGLEILILGQGLVADQTRHSATRSTGVLGQHLFTGVPVAQPLSNPLAVRHQHQTQNHSDGKENNEGPTPAQIGAAAIRQGAQNGRQKEPNERRKTPDESHVLVEDAWQELDEGFLFEYEREHLPIFNNVGDTKAVSAAYANSMPMTAAEIRVNSQRVLRLKSNQTQFTPSFRNLLQEYRITDTNDRNLLPHGSST